MLPNRPTIAPRPASPRHAGHFGQAVGVAEAGGEVGGRQLDRHPAAQRQAPFHPRKLELVDPIGGVDLEGFVVPRDADDLGHRPTGLA